FACRERILREVVRFLGSAAHFPDHERFCSMMTRCLAALAAVLIPLGVSAAQPALDGNCPVCLVEMEKAVPGSEEHAVTYDRQVYYFPSAKEKEMFTSNPAKYAPALGGDCVVCRVNMGLRMPGKIEFAVV